MTQSAQEKAKELYDKFHFVLPSYSDEGQQEHKSAKECALIAVDEIINAIDWHDYDSPNEEWGYWNEVKQEIQNYGNNN